MAPGTPEPDNKWLYLDFDGTVHTYKPGSDGSEIEGELVPGAAEAIAKLRAAGWKVAIFSARARDEDGRMAIVRRLLECDVDVDKITAVKGPAFCYVDDRGMQFTGSWDDVLYKLKRFTPWHKMLCNLCGKSVDYHHYYQDGSELTCVPCAHATCYAPKKKSA